MIYCAASNHPYDPRRRWCPICGEPNPIFTNAPVGEKPDCAMLFHHIPKELKRRFKKACAVTGTTMRDAIIVFMEGFCNEKGYPREPQYRKPGH